MIPADVIEDVKARVDVLEVIGRHVQLRKSGTSFVGRCPFHEEKTGSFRVYPNDKRWRCYGCSKHGDVFQFFTYLEGKRFDQVVRELAAQVNVTLPGSGPLSPAQQRGREERLVLLAACESAALYWTEQLAGLKGEPARAYLAERGVTEETARAFRLGYALPGYHELQVTLGGKRISSATQHGAGLLMARGETPDKRASYYDRFRSRLIFPIADQGGQVIGFGGRAIGNEEGAKYLNSPETLLYKKSRVLYGLERAKDAIRKTGRAVLVEGFFDVVSLHQAGVTHSVGACGTAFTAEHVEALRRCGCQELALLFDGDAAGAKAVTSVAPVVLCAGLATTVAVLPTAGGKVDPDQFVRQHGKGGIEMVVDAAEPLTEFLISQAIRGIKAASGPQAAVEQKLRMVRDLTPIVLAAPEGLARSTFERSIARRLDLDIGPLRAEIQREAEAKAARESSSR